MIFSTNTNPIQRVLFLAFGMLALVTIVFWILTPSFKKGAEESRPKARATAEPIATLTAKEKTGDVSAEKAAILARVRSRKPLTAAEKAQIGAVMLFRSQPYRFSDAERVLIFKALNRK